MRRKIVRIPARYIGEMVLSRAHRKYELVNVPSSAVYVATAYDPMSDCYLVLIEDESFPVVPEGCLWPHVEVIVYEIQQ